MSATPRIVFSTFSSTFDPMFLAWARFLRSVEVSGRPIAGILKAQAESSIVPVTGDQLSRRPDAQVSVAGSTGTGSACGVWRILASNNRELGRSARAYTSHASAIAHVLALRSAVGELQLTTVNGNRTGMHGWYLSHGRRPVITCGRWYGAAASGATAAAAALEALSEALVEETARRLEPPRRTAGLVEDVVW